MNQVRAFVLFWKGVQPTATMDIFTLTVEAAFVSADGGIAQQESVDVDINFGDIPNLIERKIVDVLVLRATDRGWSLDRGGVLMRAVVKGV